MIERKINCWQYMKCGREPGGVKADELGVCPAAVINRGRNAGRFCWAVAGTFCGGRVQGSFAEKRESCFGCEFFHNVRAQEGSANLQTRFLRFVSRDARSPLFKGMAYQHIKSGSRFIRQGEPGDSAYIIQRGSCMAIVEKNGEYYPVGHRGEGDIVGVMSLLTGEPRAAHVEAETDMEAWVLKKKQFDDISTGDPELMCFLTELVADRFDSKRPIADRTIGKYRATDIIGRGGFSLVYKGEHLDLAMPVAIKMMRHDLAMDADFLANFRNEAITIAGLNHENIVKVYDIEERFRTVFIIMEYLEGESVSEMLGRLKKIQPFLAADYLLQVSAGLQYAHRQGIIHRDINTKNIIIQHDDRVKILDFGLACPIGTEDFSSLGTVAYMAPEQIESDPLDQRTDIYALGVVAYEMLVGERPFPEEDIRKLMHLHRTMDIPDPAIKNPDLPQALRNFIRKAGRCDPQKRYQDMIEALEEIQPLAGISGTERKSLSADKPRQAAIRVSYEDNQQAELKRLMEEFAARAERIGVKIDIVEG